MNFTMTELLKSETATKNKINNIPTDTKVLDNLLDLIVYVLQPLRDKLKKPIIITSGYRCKNLNTLVGGVGNSQHLYGQACDFVVPNMTVQQVFDFVKSSGIEYHQLINEYNQWVHISFVKNNNRKQAFKL